MNITIILALCFSTLSLGQETAIELYDQASKIYFEKGELKFNYDYNKRIKTYKKALTLEPSFIEAHIALAETYSDISNSKPQFNLAIKHYSTAIELISKGVHPLLDNTIRCLVVDCAEGFHSIYELQKMNDLELIKKAIQLFQKALTLQHEEKEKALGDGPDFCSNNEILKSISSKYLQIAEFYKINYDFYLSEEYLDSAETIYLNIEYSDYYLNDIKLQRNIIRSLLENHDWTVIRRIGKLSKQPEELLNKSGELYFYNKESIKRTSQSQIRIWLLLDNISDENALSDSDVDKTKLLVEFDLKEDRYRILEEILFNSKSRQLNLDTQNGAADWYYINPDSIYFIILKLLKNKTII